MGDEDRKLDIGEAFLRTSSASDLACSLAGRAHARRCPWRLVAPTSRPARADPVAPAFFLSRQNSTRGVSTSNPKAGQLTEKLKAQNKLVDSNKTGSPTPDQLSVSRRPLPVLLISVARMRLALTRLHLILSTETCRLELKPGLRPRDRHTRDRSSDLRTSRLVASCPAPFKISSFALVCLRPSTLPFSVSSYCWNLLMHRSGTSTGREGGELGRICCRSPTLSGLEQVCRDRREVGWRQEALEHH